MFYFKTGDRYWYENDIPPSSFTREQLAEIRKTTLAQVRIQYYNDKSLFEAFLGVESQLFEAIFLRGLYKITVVVFYSS